MSATNALKRGALIVIEGVDRSGKSTQCKKLIESLKKSNIRSELLSFPDRTTPIGKLINEYLNNKTFKLNDHAIHLLFTANRWESFNKIKEYLENGVSLIVDRYSHSGIAFSSIKNGMDFNWCKESENGLPKPDLVFLLTMNSNELSNRPGFGGERYENEDIQNKVASVFLNFSQTEDNWKVVDASQSMEEVHTILLNQILLTIKEVADKPVEYFNFSNHNNE